MYNTSLAIVGSLSPAARAFGSVTGKDPAGVEKRASEILNTMTSGFVTFMELSDQADTWSAVLTMLAEKKEWIKGMIVATAQFPAGPPAEALKYLKDGQRNLELLESQVRKRSDENDQD